MNIVFLFDSTYPHYTGGIETWVYNVSERMADDNEITIFNVENFRKDDKNGVYKEINKRVNFISVKNMNHIKPLSYLCKAHITLLNSNITANQMVKAFGRFRKDGEKYYVIALGTIFAAKACRKIKEIYPDIVSIVSCRSLHPEVLGESFPGTLGRLLKIEAKNLSNVDAIWSNGEDTREALLRKGFDSTVIRNGIDVKRLENISPYDFSLMGLEGKRTVVTIGTVQKIKGYYELIDAISILKEKYNFELHLVGIGKGNLDRFMNYAKLKGVEDRIHFTGEQRDVIKYAKSADIIACLSGGSGYGMAALESMLSYRPVIAWDSPVYRQIIKDNVNGYLVPEGNRDSLADKIYNNWNEIINNQELTKKAHDSVLRFDWTNVIEDITNELKKF